MIKTCEVNKRVPVYKKDEVSVKSVKDVSNKSDLYEFIYDENDPNEKCVNKRKYKRRQKVNKQCVKFTFCNQANRKKKTATTKSKSAVKKGTVSDDRNVICERLNNSKTAFHSKCNIDGKENKNTNIVRSTNSRRQSINVKRSILNEKEFNTIHKNYNHTNNCVRFVSPVCKEITIKQSDLQMSMIGNISKETANCDFNEHMCSVHDTPGDQENVTHNNSVSENNSCNVEFNDFDSFIKTYCSAFESCNKPQDLNESNEAVSKDESVFICTNGENNIDDVYEPSLNQKIDNLNKLGQSNNVELHSQSQDQNIVNKNIISEDSNTYFGFDETSIKVEKLSTRRRKRSSRNIECKEQTECISRIVCNNSVFENNNIYTGFDETSIDVQKSCTRPRSQKSKTKIDCKEQPKFTSKIVKDTVSEDSNTYFGFDDETSLNIHKPYTRQRTEKNKTVINSKEHTEFTSNVVNKNTFLEDSSNMYFEFDNGISVNTEKLPTRRTRKKEQSKFTTRNCGTFVGFDEKLNSNFVQCKITLIKKLINRLDDKYGKSESCYRFDKSGVDKLPNVLIKNTNDQISNIVNRKVTFKLPSPVPRLAIQEESFALTEQTTHTDHSENVFSGNEHYFIFSEDMEEWGDNIKNMRKGRRCFNPYEPRESTRRKKKNADGVETKRKAKNKNNQMDLFVERANELNSKFNEIEKYQLIVE